MGLFDFMKKKAIVLGSPAEGECVPLSQVNDPTFSGEILGKGVAIIPSKGTICAPADGEVGTVFPTGHAVALTTPEGAEVLIHIGLDTVDMNGDGFEYLITKGQRVKAGTPLIRFSKEKIRAAGHRDVTMCIISDPGHTKNLRYQLTENAKAGETVVATFE